MPSQLSTGTLTRFAACAFFRYYANICCKLLMIVRFGVRVGEIKL